MPFFTSSSGVRQGENLYPVLYSIYLNDLDDYLSQNRNAGFRIDFDDEYMSVMTRLVVLLYTYDTIMLASNENDLQHSLDKFNEFCQD